MIALMLFTNALILKDILSIYNLKFYVIYFKHSAVHIMAQSVGIIISMYLINIVHNGINL